MHVLVWVVLSTKYTCIGVEICLTVVLVMWVMFTMRSACCSVDVVVFSVKYICVDVCLLLC